MFYDSSCLCNINEFACSDLVISATISETFENSGFIAGNCLCIDFLGQRFRLRADFIYVIINITIQNYLSSVVTERDRRVITGRLANRCFI